MVAPKVFSRGPKQGLGGSSLQVFSSSGGVEQGFGSDIDQCKLQNGTCVDAS